MLRGQTNLIPKIAVTTSMLILGVKRGRLGPGASEEGFGSRGGKVLDWRKGIRMPATACFDAFKWLLIVGATVQVYRADYTTLPRISDWKRSRDRGSRDYLRNRRRARAVASIFVLV